MDSSTYQQTLYSVINHVLNQHPELRLPVRTLLNDKEEPDWLRGFQRHLSEKYDETTASFVKLLLRKDNSVAKCLLRYADRSKSQLCQDLFVQSELNFKRGGYFVEFGAANGVDHSNTYMLEADFGWDGIIAEPARQWHSHLLGSRKCSICLDCVWTLTGESLPFKEAGELSTIENYKASDHHTEARLNAISYNVNTISMLDLLKLYNAPTEIDYLSIDTEGSEYEILNAFDFSKYKFRVITCEHNFTPMRKKIEDLLRSKGYQRVFEEISWFDDWYIQQN
jgi:FkbM family methyltransferase